MSPSRLGMGTCGLVLLEFRMVPAALLGALLKVPGWASDAVWVPTVTFPSWRAAAPELGGWAQPSVWPLLKPPASGLGRGQGSLRAGRPGVLAQGQGWREGASALSEGP